MADVTDRRARWYRSFYWRIALSFVVLVIAVIFAQHALFALLFSRSGVSVPGRSPNTLAAVAAADIGAALAQDSSINLQAYLEREYSAYPLPIYVVTNDGQTAATSKRPLDASVRASIDAILSGTDPRSAPAERERRTPPVVTAPVQVGGQLRAMVLIPPNRPERSPFARAIDRVFSPPATALLIAGATIAALFIFAPVRRRLQSLEQATKQLGAGDLTARAPEQGSDEIARVAAAFNRMAGELAARDEALRTSDRLRRQMLADVSHELKTPLTTMRGYLETLRMPDVHLDTATRERYFDTLERETRRLDRIVKDLVDLAQLENGVVSFAPRLFSVGRLFDHIIDRHDREAKARRMTISQSVSDDADQIVGDPDRLEQVVENLVVNALRHTPDGGAIELSANRNGDTATVLTVADSGEGISPEHVHHVFDRFYKVDAARSAGASGSGLGLSIAKAIVERHGGTIDVGSQPGRTVFTIVLPEPTAARD